MASKKAVSHFAGKICAKRDQADTKIPGSFSLKSLFTAARELGAQQPMEHPHPETEAPVLGRQLLC